WNQGAEPDWYSKEELRLSKEKSEDALSEFERIKAQEEEYMTQVLSKGFGFDHPDHPDKLLAMKKEANRTNESTSDYRESSRKSQRREPELKRGDRIMRERSRSPRRNSDRRYGNDRSD